MLQAKLLAQPGPIRAAAAAATTPSQQQQWSCIDDTATATADLK
jgi:hypothetical protein